MNAPFRWHAMLVCIAQSILITGCGPLTVGSSGNSLTNRMPPDWSGLWEQYVVDESGLLTEDMIADIATLTPPYNAEWQRKFEQAIAQHSQRPPAARICTIGFPSLMLFSPLMFEVLITPKQTALIFSHRETRHIYTDGSVLPDQSTLWPTPWGHSIGRWEGSTLVIETVATNSPLTPFGVSPLAFAPLSESVRFIERLRMLDDNTLEDQLTIDDPIAFTRSWTLTRHYHRVPTMKHLVDEDCLGDDRNPVVNGEQTIAPSERSMSAR